MSYIISIPLKTKKKARGCTLHRHIELKQAGLYPPTRGSMVEIPFLKIALSVVRVEWGHRRIYNNEKQPVQVAYLDTIPEEEIPATDDELKAAGFQVVIS